MKETTFFDDPDYLKIKTFGAPSIHSTMPAIWPSTHAPAPKLPPTFLTKAEQEAIDREKDRQFQLLFNTLWPNIHGKLEDKTTAQKLAAEQEKNKALSEILLKQELEKIEKLKKEEEAKKHASCIMTCCSSSGVYKPATTTTTCHDAFNISINGLTSVKG